MRSILIAALAAVLFVASSGDAAAQGITEQQATEILNELRAIRQLLERGGTPTTARPSAAPPTARAKLSTAPAYAMGRDDALVTLVEFTDLQCPFCRQFHVTTFEQIKKDWIDTGKVRFVSRDFPLAFHAQAMPAAHAARCAGDQSRYWEMRHTLQVNASALSRDAMFTFARQLGLDMDRFSACFVGEKFKAEIQRDMAEAQAAGVSGTPTFVIGRTAADGFEGEKIVGAQPYPIFEAKIRELLGP